MRGDHTLYLLPTEHIAPLTDAAFAEKALGLLRPFLKTQALFFVLKSLKRRAIDSQGNLMPASHRAEDAAPKRRTMQVNQPTCLRSA